MLKKISSFFKALLKKIESLICVDIDLGPSVNTGAMNMIENKPGKSLKSDLAAKRTRKKGKFVGDDKSTSDVNEAYKSGKKPPSKAKIKKKPNLKVQD